MDVLPSLLESEVPAHWISTEQPSGCKLLLALWDVCGRLTPVVIF